MYYKHPIYNNYEINKKGYIRDRKTLSYTKIFIIGGVLYTSLLLDIGIYRDIPLDRIILSSFIGELQYDIIHKNNNMYDCSSSNLKYDVPIEDFDNCCIGGNEIYIMPGYMPYGITKTGILVNTVKRKILKIGIDKQGYRDIELYVNKKKIHTRIHRLIAHTFIGDITDMDVNHIDNNPYNNDISNLEIVPHCINSQHYTSLYSKSPRLNAEKVKFICSALSNGNPINSILQELGFENTRLNRGLIHDIKRGKTWINISNMYNFSNYECVRKLSHRDKIAIKELLRAGESRSKIAAMFDVSYQTIKNIDDK